MNENKIKLWEPDATPSSVAPLRKPSTSPNVKSTTSNAEDRNKTEQKEPVDVVSRSSLSAEAEEWYPPNFEKPVAGKTGGSVQHRLNIHKQTQNTSSSQGNDSEQNVNVELDIKRLKNIINTLTNDPGQFDDLVFLFVETLTSYFENVSVILEVSQLLFEQALREPNFRYTAARLCCIIEEQSSFFRTQLHLICQKEVNSKPDNHNLLLFVAELYTQLHYENLYGSCLLELIQSLLSAGNIDNIKYICQALKLTGRSLEYYNKSALNEVFLRLETFRPRLSSTVISILNSVIALRNVNWGQSTPPVSNNSSNEEEAYWGQYEGQAIDEQEISPEERNFLDDNLEQSHDFLGDDSDPDELCDPEPEMDEEIQAAFKEFVKLSKR